MLLPPQLLRTASRRALAHRLRPCRSSSSSSSGSASVHAVAASGFESQAATYERVRPSYPPAALEFVVQDVIKRAAGSRRRIRVLDLASGTGKFTRLLAAFPELEVVAVEPVAAMRAVFNQVLPPTVGVLEGAADRIPFADGHFDAVSCAQSFHWFDHMAALREIRRVLRPGGALTLTWNMESRQADWVGALRDVYEPYDHGIPQYRTGRWKEVFATAEALGQLFPGPLRTRMFMQEMLVTKAEVWQRVLSKSYIAALPPAEQAVVKAKVKAVLAQHDAAFDVVVRDQRDGTERRCARQPIETEVTYVLASSS